MPILNTAKVTEQDIKNASTNDILETYNAVMIKTGAPEKVVKKFTDRKTAELRLWKLVGTLPPGEDISKSKKEAAKTETKPAKVVEKTTKTVDKKAKRTMRFCFAPANKSELKEPRKTSLRGQLFDLFKERGTAGLLFSEVQAKFPHWKKTDVYEGIRLIHFTTGYGMWSAPEGEDIRIQLVGEKQLYSSLLSEAKKAA